MQSFPIDHIVVDIDDTLTGNQPGVAQIDSRHLNGNVLFDLLRDCLVEAGVFASKGEGRRTVKNGGLYLNSARVEDESALLSAESLLTPSMAVVRVGKKNYHLLRFE